MGVQSLIFDIDLDYHTGAQSVLYSLIWSGMVLNGLDYLGLSQMMLDGLSWYALLDVDHHKMVLKMSLN